MSTRVFDGDNYYFNLYNSGFKSNSLFFRSIQTRIQTKYSLQSIQNLRERKSSFSIQLEIIHKRIIHFKASKTETLLSIQLETRSVLVIILWILSSSLNNYTLKNLPNQPNRTERTNISLVIYVNKAQKISPGLETNCSPPVVTDDPQESHR